MSIDLLQALHKVQFIIVPFMAPGHMIPMVDLGRLLAAQGIIVTIITTPHNTSRFKSTIDYAEQTNLPLRFVSLHFPGPVGGLPEGCENFDSIPSVDLCANFFTAIWMLKEPLQAYLQQHMQADDSPPLCMISDFLHPWTSDVAQELKIPRFVFYSVCCFTLACHEILPEFYEREGVIDEKKLVIVPAIPHRVEVAKAQASGFFSSTPKLGNEVKEAEATADGIIVNTVAEMEPMYVGLYEKAKGKKVWPVGPVSLCNKDMADKAARGRQSTVNEAEVLSFLDSMKPKSVVYVSLGSLARTPPAQVVEIGLGLEESGHPFIWVIRSREKMPEVEEWLGGGFEERNKGKSLVIRGWASQDMILSHPSVGGFVTHCGWNSTMEGITAGVPMVTWPGFADQFLNERFLVNVLGTGVMVGVKEPIWWWDDVVAVERDGLAEVVKKLMDGGEEGEERRRRALEFGEKARKAMDVGGSSHQNITDLIDEVLKLVAEKKDGIISEDLVKNSYDTEN